MFKPKFFIFVAVFLFCVSNLTAQVEAKRQTETSFEIILQVLDATNKAEQGKIPTSLNTVVKKLKTEYPLSNFNLAATYLQRISVGGIINHKGFYKNSQSGNLDENIFTNWSLNNLQMGSSSNGKDIVQFQAFSFGARVPVTTSSLRDEKGGSRPIINYESVGVDLSKFNVLENVPTVIGSLSAQKPDEITFLILTVRKVEY